MGDLLSVLTGWLIVMSVTVLWVLVRIERALRRMERLLEDDDG